MSSKGKTRGFPALAIVGDVAECEQAVARDDSYSQSTVRLIRACRGPSHKGTYEWLDHTPLDIPIGDLYNVLFILSKLL